MKDRNDLKLTVLQDKRENIYKIKNPNIFSHLFPNGKIDLNIT